MSVSEAQQLVDEENKQNQQNRKASVDQAKSNEKLTLSKQIQQSKIGKGLTKEQKKLANKTPTMGEVLKSDRKPSLTPKKSPAKNNSVPPPLTFEDIQNMHFSNINNMSKRGTQVEEFRPQDFLDLESGDSDNEILANFKPEADAQAQKQQFLPPYL